MTDIIIAIVSSVIGSSGIVTLITFLINRHDRKKNGMGKIIKQLDKLEKDTVRTQLLLLMNNYKGEEAELLTCAEHYFTDLKGNWYMTTMFNKFVQQNHIAKPEWLQDE